MNGGADAGVCVSGCAWQVKFGEVKVVRRTLAARMREYVNPKRLQVFYEKLISRRRLNQELSGCVVLARRTHGQRRGCAGHAWYQRPHSAVVWYSRQAPSRPRHRRQASASTIKRERRCPQ